MLKIKILRLAIASMFTMAILYTLIAFIFMIAPDLSFGYLRSIASGFGLTTSGAVTFIGMTFQDFLLGLICVAAGAFALGIVFSVVFNRTADWMLPSERASMPTVRTREA